MAKIIINYEFCKKCGICAVFCPQKVFSFNELAGLKVEEEEKCSACDKCVIMCPDFAIKVIK